MTGMEHAIEQVARAIYGAMHRDTDPYSVPLERAAEKAARRLAADGLLAPAPLTEEWAIRHPHLGLIDKRRDQAHAERGRGNGWDPVYRHSTGWLPVDRAEGDGRADQ